jgi:Ca2+-binding EF-hand superfamily protein
MGCSHGKATSAPVTNAVSASAAKPANTSTLLNATSQQKHAAVDKGASQPLAGKSSSDVVDVKLKALFDKIDTDKNGYVDAKELAAALRQEPSLLTALEKAGLNSQWYVLEQIDSNEDGKITWREFQMSLKKPAALTKDSSSEVKGKGKGKGKGNETPEVKVVMAEGSTHKCFTDELRSKALRSKALRIYVMADKSTDDARLHVNVLAPSWRLDLMLQRVLEIRSDASLSQTEWLEVVRKAADRDCDQTNAFLDVCQKHLEQQKEHWPLRQQALNVFFLGDRNNDGQLDMDELTEMRQSSDFAQALMDTIDLDKNGTVSKGEWLAYIKRLADMDEQSAAAVLELYKRALTKTSPVLRTEAVPTLKSDTDKTLRERKEIIPILEDSTANANQRWWACC